MSDRYLIISADTHAGLPCDEYRPYLEARYHAAFDDYLAELCAVNPVRRGGVGLVPITHDIDRGVEEVEWLAAQPGIRGVMVPAERPAPNGGDAIPVIASASANMTSAETPSASSSLSRCWGSKPPRRPSSLSCSHPMM